MNNKIIAIDFDGTIVSENFPYIGEFLPEAKETIIDLYKAGYKLILWTCRTDAYKDENGNPGNYLIKALAFLEMNNMLQYFYEVNDNYDKNCDGRKVYAHYYIDDRNLGGFPGWKTVREILL